MKAFKASGFDGRSPPDKPSEEPASFVSLEHAFGTRGSTLPHDGKCSVAYSAQGAVVAAVGSLAFVQEMEDLGAKNRSQCFLQKHRHEVTCLAVDVCGQKVATGDSHGNVHVWCAEEKAHLKQLPSKTKHDARGGIIALSFSRAAQYLVSVGGDADHKMVVWDWEKGDGDAKACVVAEDKCGNTKILDVACNPYDQKNAVSMVSVGMKHVKFWKMEEAKPGAKLTKYGGKTDTNVVCADFMPSLAEDPDAAAAADMGYCLTGGLENGQVSLSYYRVCSCITECVLVA